MESLVISVFFNLFKTVRKFFGEAVVVTQEVEDILSSPIVGLSCHYRRYVF